MRTLEIEQMSQIEGGRSPSLMSCGLLVGLAFAWPVGTAIAISLGPVACIAGPMIEHNLKQ